MAYVWASFAEPPHKINQINYKFQVGFFCDMRNNLCLRCHKYSLGQPALPTLKIAYIVL